MTRARSRRPRPRLDGLVQVGWSFRRFQEAVARHLGAGVRGRRIVIYGTGLSGQLLAPTLEALGATLVGVVDGNPAMVGRLLNGLPVHPVEALSDTSLAMDAVIVAASLPASAEVMQRTARRLVGPGVAVHALTDIDFAGDAAGVPAEDWPVADPVTHAPQPLPSDLHWMRQVARRGPLAVQVIVSIRGEAPALRRRTLASLRAQIHKGWTATDEHGAPLADGRRTSAAREALRLQVHCPAGAVLPPYALFEWAVQGSLWPERLPLAVAIGAEDLAIGSGAPAVVTIDVDGTRVSGVGTGVPLRAAPLAFGTVRPPGAPWPRVAGRRSLPVIFSRAPLVHLDRADVRRVLVIKLDHIGDVVLSVPVIESLRRRFPAAEITVLAGSWAAPLLEDVVVRTGVVNRVVALDVFHEVSGHGRRAADATLRETLTARLGSAAFDLAVDLRRPGDARDVLQAVTARWKVAFGDEDAYTQLGIPGYASRARTHVPLHIVDQLDVLLGALLDRRPADLPRSLPPPPESGREWLPRRVARRPWVVALAPGSGDQLRMWPAQSYAALASRLARELGAGVAFVGSGQEQPLIAEILSAMPTRQRAVSLAGALSLNEFRAALHECHLFIGNTTGPTHIAAASGVPTLNIFSGQVSPTEWAPRGPEAFVVWTRPSCAPCYLPAGACPYGRVCLTSITPSDAFEAARRILLTTYGTLAGAAGRR